MHSILANKSFLKEYAELVSNYPVIAHKILIFKDDVRVFGFSHTLFRKYDIKSLGDGFFRLKFIPIRVILYVDDKAVYLEKIFKRKGKSDYRDYK